MNWWTTDLDIIDACHSVGAKDVEQLSIYENKETGRSKVCIHCHCYFTLILLYFSPLSFEQAFE